MEETLNFKTRRRSSRARTGAFKGLAEAQDENPQAGAPEAPSLTEWPGKQNLKGRPLKGSPLKPTKKYSAPKNPKASDVPPFRVPICARPLAIDRKVGEGGGAFSGPFETKSGA